jgi:RNA polymerase sigma factor (sigma-70 family)
MTLQTLTDTALWKRARGGDDEAFGMLFDRHSRTVYNFCFRRTADWSAAEDLTSVVFLETWKRRGELRMESGSLLPWLYGVATNVLNNHRRSLRRHRDALARIPALPSSPDDAEEVTARLDAERQMRQVLESIKALPRKDREVLALCVWEGLGYNEAAEALGIPVGTVRSRLARARARLRDGTDPPVAEPRHSRGHEKGERPTTLFTKETP